MGKLPKSMQNRNKQIKELRAKGSSHSKSKHRAPPVAQNRQMRRRLQKQGIGDMEQIEARRVIIQKDDEDLIIENPQIIRVAQQGMNVYQVIGEAEPHPSGKYVGVGTDFATADEIDASNITAESRGNLQEAIAEEEEISLNVEITEQDIQLVVMQTNVSPEVAKQTLQETNGDLAKAIIKLKTQ
ncbi:MAG: hypothetical protein DRO88_09565 [Promethearchaeia archaeon]|nr:MAG: hypothetical protein DRO88_09565 [Candidatus Lokiarchaeia archaeon]